MRALSRIFLPVVAAALVIGAICLYSLFFANQADTFVPLPPPVGEEYPLNQIVQTIGETEQVKMQAPFASVDFGQTGSFAGGVKLEELCLKLKFTCATMLSTEWGSWSSATIQRAQTYDPEGRILGASIEQSLPNASILQWLHGCIECTIKRSILVFEYVSPVAGATPLLTSVHYYEEWGIDGSHPMAFGTAHRWDDAADLFPVQAKWGFWESKIGPFEQVIAALQQAQTTLQTHKPAMQVVDSDSAGREFIGRQSGFDIVHDGITTGSIDLTYSNGWGQMPNTELIGKGALSRIEWVEGAKYYSMVVLSPVLSPEPSSLYVFCSTKECADYVTKNQAEWPLLYGQIRSHQIEGLQFAVYAIGHIGQISKSTGEDIVHVGDGGGVHYSIIGSPSFSQVDAASRHINMLGLNGVKALGLYYATKPASGSGLEYYLEVVRLSLTDWPLEKYGEDVGALDRVGFLPVD